MKHAHSGIRRSVSSIAALALAAAATAVLASPTRATPSATPSAAPSVSSATGSVDATVPIVSADLTWGLNGYSQVGIFGPWTYKDLSGNVTQLVGSVSGGSQTEYAVDPVPATSMPRSTPQKTPNAVRFTAGTGTANPVTGASTLSWEGSYTVNAYPAQFNAPNEVYSDPELTTAPDGSGVLTMDFTLGAGTDMSGNPVDAQDFGRITLATFDAGSSAPITGDPDGFRLTPDYQGVAVSVPADGSPQDTSCTTAGGATGWWGSWPEELIDVLPASVRPHFYSTGCSGMQDYKPALPVDVDLNLPSVTVSDTTLLPSGVQQVTVTGTGFHPSMVTGNRPPLMGRPAGAYVAFGRYADTWRPSQGAGTSARVNQGGGALKWAVLAEDTALLGGQSGSAVTLDPDGTFTATLAVDKDAMDALAATGNYGVYTYAGSYTHSTQNSVAGVYETYTPVSFDTTPPTTTPTPAPTPTASSTPAPSPTPEPGTTDEPVRGIAKVRWGTRPTAARRGTAVVKVSELATGKATVMVRTAKGRKVKALTVRIKDATVRATLPRLARGTYALVVKVPGNDAVGKAKVTRTFRVR